MLPQVTFYACAWIRQVDQTAWHTLHSGYVKLCVSFALQTRVILWHSRSKAEADYFTKGTTSQWRNLGNRCSTQPSQSSWRRDISQHSLEKNWWWPNELPVVHCGVCWSVGQSGSVWGWEPAAVLVGSVSQWRSLQAWLCCHQVQEERRGGCCATANCRCWTGVSILQVSLFMAISLCHWEPLFLFRFVDM